jgi:hypothetical protein
MSWEENPWNGRVVLGPPEGHDVRPEPGVRRQNPMVAVAVDAPRRNELGEGVERVQALEASGMRRLGGMGGIRRRRRPLGAGSPHPSHFGWCSFAQPRVTRPWSIAPIVPG